MSIRMAGIDHSLAPLPVRERFSFTKKACGEAYETLKEDPRVCGALILSTCNRTELWLSAREDFRTADLLCELRDLPAGPYREMIREREGETAVRHLFRVVSGLRSQVVGEDQILTQTREAWNLARESEATDSVLDVLLRMALTAGKKAKSRMQISTANLSAVSQAVQFLRNRGYDFQGKKCLVIGNGEMGKRAALALTAEGADVTVTVRQYRSGHVEIPRGCRRVNYGERLALLPACDLVVSATNSPNLTLRAEEIAPIPRPQEQIFVDLAVPRDIAPEIGELPGASLYDIDHFPADPSGELAESLAEAEEIVREQTEEFLTWYDCRDIVPRVQDLGSLAAEDLWKRMGQTLKELDLPEETAGKLEQAVREAEEKVMRRCLFALRDEAGTEVFRAGVEAMEKVYHE